MTSPNPAPANIVKGESPLERRLLVSLDAKDVQERKRKVMREESGRIKRPPGFRKGSKVLPPAYLKELDPLCQERAINELATPKVNEMVREAELKIFPGFWVEEFSFEEDGRTCSITCGIEVVPDVPEPALEGKELRLVEPVVSPEAVEQVLARIKRNYASWEKVDRTSRDGDRVTFRHLGLAANDKDLSFDLADERLDPALKARFMGVKEGDAVAVPMPPAQQGDEPQDVNVDVTGVLWPKLPEEDLAFARTLDPEVGSMEAFRADLTRRVEDRYGRMAEQLNMSRALSLLESTTGGFELPARNIDLRVSESVRTAAERLRQDGYEVAEKDLNRDAFEERTKREMRSSLIFTSFVERNSLEVSREEALEQLEQLAQEEDNPDAFLAKAKDDPERMGMAARHRLALKVLEAVGGKVEVKRVRTEQGVIEEYVSKGDPEIRGAGDAPGGDGGES